MYIEKKTGYQDNGPAWIGLANFSSSGRTVYFNGKALKRSGGQSMQGNHFDIETGDEYWVSGVKKDGSDRHWAGGGIIKIEARVVDEYLALRCISKLDLKKYTICEDIVETDVSRFHDMENTRL
jgi:hypothetical protein